MIGLSVRGGARTLPRSSRDRLRRRLHRAMVAAGVGEAEVALSLIDDAEMQALNRSYRRKDRPTDVLSFSMREGEGAELHPELLGDLVISVDTARRQAAEHAHDLDAELLHLAVHGLAHLLGYDHATTGEEQRMFAYEARLREQACGRRAVVTVAP